MTQLSYPVPLAVSRSISRPVSRDVSKAVASSALNARQKPVAHHDIPQGLPPDNQTAGILPPAFVSTPSTPGRWEAFARHDLGKGTSLNPNAQQSPNCPALRQKVHHRTPCNSSSASLQDDEARYLPLSRTTDRVLRILLDGDLSRVRAESVAESLGISCTTLRRRLRSDHTSYQFLLDRARQYRCESRLRARWLPGKCLADELGYLEVNSFYRAFRRWTGLSYSDYRQMYH
ncbi:AraC family transcriptional regulator [Congregibacter variabilis]|uniref:AraC family transcriptional regulator n=1 Tax=Congregibacter variabilis TaxID=3081200 RepID=A0ABZ0I4R3_9GAMM|nr:AraC family transcriptional regulator [Congregibacter sp. IMCC43200]